jgi:hypothetical protein
MKLAGRPAKSTSAVRWAMWGPSDVAIRVPKGMARRTHSATNTEGEIAPGSFELLRNAEQGAGHPAAVVIGPGLTGGTEPQLFARLALCPR